MDQGVSLARRPLSATSMEDKANPQAGACPGIREDTPGHNEEGATAVDMKLEVAVVPVSDVDKAKDFYRALTG